MLFHSLLFLLHVRVPASTVQYIRKWVPDSGGVLYKCTYFRDYSSPVFYIMFSYRYLFSKFMENCSSILFIKTKLLRVTGSRDGLKLSWNTWVDLGLRKGRGRFGILEMLQFQKEKNIFLLLVVNEKLTLLDWLCFRRVFSHTYLAFYWSVQQTALISIGWTNVQIHSTPAL